MENKLNKRESYKARLKPIDFYKNFENLDFENLSEGDRFYLQDFGIFTTDFLEDEFTIRIRIPGGRITPEQFLAIASIVLEYELTIVLTSRAGIQLHNIDVENLLEIHQKVNSLSLSTWQSFGDNIRNIVTDPFDGIGQYAEIETQPIIEKMQNYILKNPRYVGMLPRRVSIGISGNSANVTSFFANDIYFALAKKDNNFGFNVYMGGKNTEVAKCADIFLHPTQVFDFFKAFVETFYLHGSRFSRSRTRLFYLIEDIGIDALKMYIEKEYGEPFQCSGELILKKEKFSPIERLKDASYSYCYQTNFSKLDSNEIGKIADFALQNSVEIRFAIDQNIYLVGLIEANTPFESPAMSSTIIACAGNLCPYGAWSIKDETSYLPLDKIQEHQIQVGFSGCMKGCGRHRHTDIGLIGLKTNRFGDTDGGTKVFLGAEHTYGKSVSRELFSMVPFVHLNSTISLVIKLFELSDEKNFEAYSRNILNHYSEGFLSLWHLMNLKTKQSIKLERIAKVQSLKYEKELLQKYFIGLELIDNDFKKSISAISKELWTVEGKDPTYKPPIKRVAFR